MSVFAFYLFAISAITGGLFTVISRQPVHSVLWLILAFISSAGLFVLLGAEFVAMLLVIVYVGAVAVLFLFVVMMLDVDFAALKAEMAQYMPLALLIGLVILMQFVMAYGSWESAHGAAAQLAQPIPEDRHNTEALGLIIYDQYFLLFQLSGLILLVAMIGAITLTLRHRKDVKRQDVMLQMSRDPAKAMELKDIKPGQGL
ncbi:MAG: NADH:ubiquinone oxidoreductase subunit J [Roseobacter sp. MedPE-SWde]|uniref:NADH-quinone oxidoreductase subunit J n=1 Tax=Roseobacteraceae TaxID=2854170 RepID=UPI000068EEA4|nr:MULTISPECIES: NADH-quinone oxidoreductase subunit J [Roseobacteraceae]EAQ46118.1 NADH dehydrogenase I, J subunit [Roseobacter sp. MED193]KPD12543.1 NADH:ubiquinone oxidoreductase subunit J [Phaeobacter sp. 11ANDIMAR09]OIQ34557.1 MAG: NADH:ubiquinone oxidoreductase subunit J [Roseobacter sp. MedPE-SWchi]OIQ42702.1 MAG: NADH:ubiquinone oxidoreductase subunit J [Roseobacter sp. MedPE-SWde]